jgi:dTDP-4-amino-4,6-dideoxygalactose transaminase
MILHGDLAPVGNRISLQSGAESLLETELSGHKYWLDSGTSALALALLDAKASFPEVDKPRAIIPGYCCPDLIAACVFAGVEAVAIDINANDPSYDLEQLRLHLDANVIAVIAVNFLGIAERLGELRQLIAALGLRARFIEDNAQWFPASNSEMEFTSDYVTFSFGRGKPMSLLGGGLLCAKAPVAEIVLDRIKKPAPPSRLLALKIAAYNILLTPQLYLLLNRNPWLRLGETRYVALANIEQFDVYRCSLLAANFAAYCARNNTLPQDLDSVVLGSGLQQLDAHCAMRRKQLLRYPLLCPDVATRDKLLKQLSSAGLGASPLYAAAIDEIAGVDGLVVVPQALKNAKGFAARFLTLPVHAQVTRRHQARMQALIGAVQNDDASPAVS